MFGFRGLEGFGDLGGLGFFGGFWGVRGLALRGFRGVWGFTCSGFGVQGLGLWVSVSGLRCQGFSPGPLRDSSSSFQGSFQGSFRSI